jgi:hypothetical protein
MEVPFDHEREQDIDTHDVESAASVEIISERKAPARFANDHEMEQDSDAYDVESAASVEILAQYAAPA